jgi:hypothetical protein
MSFNKTREIIAAIVAIILIILFAAVGAALMGWDIPGLKFISNAMGISKQ